MALLTLAIVSCTTEEEKMLEGEWQGEVREKDDDGDETIYRVGMSFNNEDDIMKLTVVYRDPDLGEYTVCQCLANGWRSMMRSHCLEMRIP